MIPPWEQLIQEGTWTQCPKRPGIARRTRNNIPHKWQFVQHLGKYVCTECRCLSKKGPNTPCWAGTGSGKKAVLDNMHSSHQLVVLHGGEVGESQLV